MNHLRVPAFVALTLLVSACGGDVHDDCPALCDNENTPEITAFAAEPATVSVGGTSMLTWEVLGNDVMLEITAEGFYSPIDVTGETSYAARPTATTTYLLRARNPAGTDQEEVIVGVEAVDPAE